MNTKKKLADLQNAVDVWRANYCAEAAQNVNLRKAVETARMTVPLIAQTAITYFLAAGKGRTAWMKTELDENGDVIDPT